MINLTEDRSTVRQALANGVELAKETWKQFALKCKALGYNQFREWLTPAPGKVACQFFTNPATGKQFIVVLSKGVAKLRSEGNLPDEALKTLSVIDGKNAAGEQRFYLSSNGINQISVDEAIAHAENYQALVAKLNAERLQKLIS